MPDEAVLALDATLTYQHTITRVPEFDGKNIELRDYIQDIRNLDSEISVNQKEKFLSSVIGKLKGPARNSINGKNFAKIDDLIKHLKKRFAPGKNYGYYSSKLQNLRMNQGETVGDFYDHLQALLSSAKSALKEELGGRFKEEMMIPINQMSIDIFQKLL